MYYYADTFGSDANYQLGFTADEATVTKIVEELALKDQDPKANATGREYDCWKTDDFARLRFFWTKHPEREYYRYLWYDNALGRVYYLEFSL